MRRFSRRMLLAWAALGAVVEGCISPTLPLPPPDAPDVSRIGEGQYRLRGSLPIPASRVLVQNTRTTVVVGKGPLQIYDLVVGAQPGDLMLLWYETNTEVSTFVPFQIDRLTPILDAGRQ